MIPITLPEKKTVQPPPQSTSKAEIIEIIEDDADVVEDILISTEDQTTFVDISAMDVVYVEPEPEEEEIFMVVEDQPEFPGGTAALLEYLRKNIKYPAICRENNIQGRVLIQFIVNRDGTVVDPEVVRSVDPNLDREALRVISTMPKWKPGLQRGKPVRVKFTVPVNFKLN
jgi:protein TonB